MNRTISELHVPVGTHLGYEVHGARLVARNAVLLALALALAACGDKGVSDQKGKSGAPTSTPKAAHDPNAISLGKELQAMLKLAPLVEMDVSETLRIAGRLEVNATRTARIGAPVTGRIVDIRVVLGKEVRQGERLADLKSQDTTAAQLAFLKAHSAEQLAERGTERAQLLLAADVIGTAELQRRQNELSVVRAEKRAAADQLRILGLAPAAIEQLEGGGSLILSAPITSTQAGTIIELKIAAGQVVQPSDSLFVVSDLSSLWAVAEVPEQQAQAVKRGQRVEIEVPAIGDAKRSGEIVFVADVVNPETRTVRVGVVLENRDRVLKPAMLVTMLVQGPSARVPVVPAAAVVREENADHVFVITAPGVARLTRAKLGAERGGVRPLLEPLPANQGVVVDGAFHLNSERQKRNLEKAG
ncbi:MAG: efflux RND transporter periplasmic adaptor subunit [Burkholderiales bacterium]